MNLDEIPHIDPAAVTYDHSFVFDAHNHDRTQLLTRCRGTDDERNLVVTVTEAGMELREKAVEVPERMAGCLKLQPEEAAELYRLLYGLLSRTGEDDGE